MLIQGIQIAPAPESVLMYCENHVQSDPITGNPVISGNYIALRDSGTVSFVPGSRVSWWRYLNNHWVDLGTWGKVDLVGPPPNNVVPEAVFPGEPWPPRYQNGALKL